MPEYSIRDKCYINTNREADTFVGIICDKGDFSVHFPLGFHISDDERELRKDIMLLVATIGATIGHQESGVQSTGEACNQMGFPIQAYLTVLNDYFERGYYREREVEYTVSKKGKISWSRTIKMQRPVLQEDEAYYLDFVTRKNTVNENQLITLIHEYCVAESFQKIGWIFTGALPPKPRIKYNPKLFKAVLNDKLNRTFNDRNRILFKAMLQIVEQLYDEDAPVEYKYGTYRFEYVWEALIDRVYGIENKSVYFPKTTWQVKCISYDNASLEPDSIMILGDNIYVLDAKYYKYGATGRLGDLPESTSINKQITYGEYVANNIANENMVYNAFLMPFDSKNTIWKSDEIICIGEATGDWRKNDKTYEHIQGILIDVKYLMQITVREDSNEIMRLSKCITDAVEGKGMDGVGCTNARAT
jgi:hypothetical protein